MVSGTSKQDELTVGGYAAGEVFVLMRIQRKRPGRIEGFELRFVVRSFRSMPMMIQKFSKIQGMMMLTLDLVSR